MGLEELTELIGSDKGNKDLAKIIQIISKSGETKRMASLDRQQLEFIFNLKTHHAVYFTGKKLNLIPLLTETYLDLTVSETTVKDKNLLQLITQIYMQEKEIDKLKMNPLGKQE